MKSKKPTASQEEPRSGITVSNPAPPNDALAGFNYRSLALRVGLPALFLWAIAIVLPGWIPKAVMGVVTLAAAGLLAWVVVYARRSRQVASIVREAGSAEQRREAIQKLEKDFKKDDSAAVFAKAQLEMQEDPRAALRTLEGLKLEKMMAPMADQARAQRAMIHLMLGETDDARVLVDNIDMKRHKDAKTCATLAAIVGEAWARTGQAKRAVELLETFDPSDEIYAELKPQLLRSRAFAYAWANNMKSMRMALKSLASINAQFLSGFITKKKHPMGVPPRGVHPMLEKEAFEMLTRSGSVPRKMEYRRG